MKPSKLIAEHKRLVRVLRSGKVKDQKREAEEQYSELKRFCRKEGIKCGKL